MCLSHLQKSSGLKELEWLLYRVVESMVAASGQVSSDQTYSYHQPPGQKENNKTHRTVSLFRPCAVSVWKKRSQCFYDRELLSECLS